MADTMSPDSPLEIRVTVTNKGAVAGIETVQLYVRDVSGEVVRPVKELKDFLRIELQTGESREISFTLSESQLRYHHSDLSIGSDPGEFRIYVGPNSRDTLEAAFHLLAQV
ncbi:Periplasmic beta-glucosidase precursor [compost metagenome]